MDPNSKQIKDLSDRLDQLLRQQDQFLVEIHRLKREIQQLKNQAVEAAPEQAVDSPAPAVQEDLSKSSPDPNPPELQKKGNRLLRRGSLFGKNDLDLERFIGENLISKIGILITVIGVAFGAKYAIDHDLISPLTRIILGYLAGIGLIGLAMRLKAKFENFSAVLLSGGLAILYIITYFAYSYYSLLPQGVAFILMALFTAFTVLAAWHYDRQIIALMGLVGAYGVPFLLSEKSGSATVLLAYMSVINAGILIIAFRKYWKPLFSTAFWLSWLIFAWWMIFGYQREEHFATGLFFGALFFLLFYGTILAYKLIRKETYRWTDILLLLANSFIFFSFGYSMLEDHLTGLHFLGLFTLANALVHFGVAWLINRDKLADRNLFYFIIGLVLVFLSIAIPVQLDGNWVTLLWAGEAALLYWLGRSREIVAYEKMALPLILLAFGSLVHDWSVFYDRGFYEDRSEWVRPVWNLQLLNSLLVCGFFGFMTWVQHSSRYPSGLPAKNLYRQALRFVVPGVLLLSLYFSFRVEIEYYFQMRDYELMESVDRPGNVNTQSFLHAGNVWVIYYSMIFLVLLSWLNIRWIRDRILGIINLGLNTYGILIFMAAGLFSLKFLDNAYTISDDGELVLHTGLSYLRYVGYLLLAALLYTTYRYQQEDFIPIKSKWPFDALLHLTALITLSVELVHLITQAGAHDATKLGLSIFWGVYSLFLIALGIASRKTYLRIGAIVLFAITLIKLFFYDIAHLNTMAKTVVLLSLGVLLLLISFLYNKFKHLIADEPNA